eukprot:TRINITY_DN16602_c0_g2_i2.p1 TRINITY_DN16602_c0_g2~~TRINITY_DN16602_c0_g2_i2.p1  ORF type:complete len:532 (-),score=69.01 TRINITY_DN16602_c0_g2_i2:23-1519(-)
MASYLLKGYCMLSETCPQGHSVPLFRTKAGTLLCCCADPACEHNPNAKAAASGSSAEASLKSNPSRQEARSQEASRRTSVDRDAQMQAKAEKLAAEMLASSPQLAASSRRGADENPSSCSRSLPENTSPTSEACAEKIAEVPLRGAPAAVPASSAQNGPSSSSGPASSSVQSKEISKYMLQGYCLLNQTCPIGHSVPLLKARDGTFVCCCGDSSCKYNIIKQHATPSNAAPSLAVENSSMLNQVPSEAKKAAESVADKTASKVPSVAKSQQQMMSDLSKRLLKGYCMLSDSCPVGHSIPLLRDKDGALVCCCGDAACEYSEKEVAPAAVSSSAVEISGRRTASSVEQKVPSSDSAGNSEAPRDTRTVEAVYEISIHDSDFRFSCASLVVRPDKRLKMTGGSFSVKLRLALCARSDGRTHDTSAFKRLVAHECRQLTEKVVLPRYGDEFQLTSSNGQLVVNSKLGHLSMQKDGSSEEEEEEKEVPETAPPGEVKFIHEF